MGWRETQTRFLLVPLGLAIHSVVPILHGLMARCSQQQRAAANKRRAISAASAVVPLKAHAWGALAGASASNPRLLLDPADLIAGATVAKRDTAAKADAPPQRRLLAALCQRLCLLAASTTAVRRLIIVLLRSDPSSKLGALAVCSTAMFSLCGSLLFSSRLPAVVVLGAIVLASWALLCGHHASKTTVLVSSAAADATTAKKLMTSSSSSSDEPLIPASTAEPCCEHVYPCSKLKFENQSLLSFINIDNRASNPMLLAAAAADHRSSSSRTRPYLSIVAKLRNATPANLPADLLERLCKIIQVPVESMVGVIRPGCILFGLTVEFPNWRSMIAGQSNLLSHPSWEETFLGIQGNGVSLNIGGSRLEARNGATVMTMNYFDSLQIHSVNKRVMTSACETITLKVAGLGGDDFKVLMRTEGGYHELEVVEETTRRPGGLTRVVARLPEAPQVGMGWLEIMLDTEDDSLVLSDATPVMFVASPVLCVLAREANTLLCPKFAQDRHFLANLLQDLSQCLHEDAEASPELILDIIESEMEETFRHLANAKSLLAADRQKQGLLGTAAKTNSLSMLQTVIAVMEELSVPADPCKYGTDAAGFTALHWAAHNGNPAMVYTLLSMINDPLQKWGCLQSRLCQRTPMELMAERCPDFRLNTQLLWDWTCMHEQLVTRTHGNDHETEECSAAQGSAAIAQLPLSKEGSTQREQHQSAMTSVTFMEWCPWLVNVLRGKPLPAKLAIAASYALLLQCFGWHDLLAVISTAILFLTLHVIVPYIYDSIYLTGLAELQHHASQHGLTVSQFLDITGADDEQLALGLGFAGFSPGSAADNAAIALTTFAFAAPGVTESWAGVHSLLALAPSLTALGLILPLRTHLARRRQHRSREWLDTAIELYWWLAITAPSIRAFSAGEPSQCSIPSHIDILKKSPVLLVGFLYSTHVWVLVAKAHLLRLSLQAEALSAAVMLAACGLVFFPASSWCMRHVMGTAAPSSLCFSWLALTLNTRAFCIGCKIADRKQRLSSFLHQREISNLKSMS